MNKRKIITFIAEYKCREEEGYIGVTLNISLSLSLENKKKRKSNLETKNPSFWPLARLWTTLYVALQGVFIGAEGRRVPDEVAHEIWYPDEIKVPRNLGFCRGFAAFLWNLATRFGAWPHLVRPSGRLLLEV